MTDGPYGQGIDRLLDIMRRLRDPDSGCPWDVGQTFSTIAPYTVEEAYEVADAIERRDLDGLRDELGDLLLQVVFHAQMAAEAGAFDFAAVVESICAKMIRRHPHVFGGDGAPDVANAAAQTVAWEEHKARERRARGDADAGALAGVPLALPALTRAEKLGKRASRAGFDWPAPEPVLDKIVEEIDELRAEMADESASVERRADELGDLLFACANLARHLGVDPEDALRRTNARFARRFRHLETVLAAQGRKPGDARLDELEGLWRQAKAEERRAPAARQKREKTE